MNIIKNGIYSLKIILKTSPKWCICFLLLSLISAVVTPIRIYLTEQLINSIIISTEKTLIYGFLLVLSIVFTNLFLLLSNLIITIIESYLNQKITPVILEKFQQIEYLCFEKKENQNMIEKISQNPQSNVLGTFICVINIVYSFITATGIILMFCRASLFIGILAIIITCPMFITESIAANREMKLRWNMTTDIRKRFYLQQLFVDRNALQEIKIFSAKDFILDKCNKLTKKINVDIKTTIAKVLQLSTVSSICSLGFTSFTLLFSTNNLIKGNISLGTFVALISCLDVYYNIIKEIVGTVAQLVRISFDIGYLRSFLNLPVRDSYDTNENILFGDIIEFKNVSFKYPNQEKLIINNLSFSIKGCEKIAFVGENGAGKTTIIKLLLGLYPVLEGEILVDGINVLKISDKEKRKIFSAVFQDFQEYQTTLRDNVAYGDIQKRNNDHELLGALEKADVLDILNMDEKGLDMNLGQLESDGKNLSKGQWQRVALSRAYLSDTKYIILDEPTASLDPIAESKMYESFSKVMRQKGTIMISHRLASAKMADRIFVIRDGCLIEQGSHNELIDKQGDYYNMYTKQASWYATES